MIDNFKVIQIAVEKSGLRHKIQEKKKHCLQLGPQLLGVKFKTKSLDMSFGLERAFANSLQSSLESVQ